MGTTDVHVPPPGAASTRVCFDPIWDETGTPSRVSENVSGVTKAATTLSPSP
ncbi:MAG TPA: hypothetical protein PLA49_01040 [Propioniciclava sp.]|uniref:hypothetical protein n=1 Tax=Propioniciclava sp. TaxID=2038686 RepID=UPI002CA560E9|nr:hypothetical protein [Propioniciclava sp.]HRL47951.1 hypothetical protein [Propioniciclava sp.]